MTSPLLLLERLDKHYLGSGDGIIFAPRFPRWLEHPGFWDEADVFHYQLAPVFTVTFLSGDVEVPAGPLSMRQISRRWSPAELVAHYELENELEGWEHRSVLPGGCFMSEWKLRNLGKVPRKLLAVAWTSQPTGELDLSTVQVSSGFARFHRALTDRNAERLAVGVTLEASSDSRVAAAAYLSEGVLEGPYWELTPFPEKWRSGVRTVSQVGGVSQSGSLYLAALAHIVVPARGETMVSLEAHVWPDGVDQGKRSGLHAAYIEEHAPVTTSPQVVDQAASTDPGGLSRSLWHEFFDEAPALACSDPFIEHYWYYRWYGLRLCGHEGGIGNYRYPGCCEGIGYFHAPIAYSAQCHARELRWLPNPDRARGVILNFLATQKESGQLHGRVYLNHLESTDFYFADWGAAALAVDAVHPDLDFLRAAYRPLASYAEWLERERDRDGSGLCDVLDHYETGQEYMSRYMAVSPDADSETWGNLIRLKGVDAAVYAYRLQRALATIAGRLHEFGDAGLWTATADLTATAIHEFMWDDENGMFNDVDPRNMKRISAKAAVCFYPYFTDLVGTGHVAGLLQHLLNPKEFWTAHPVPSTSADDPYYSADAEWKGKRHNCPWNGRVWPMANSHVAEAIARTAIEHDPSLRATAAELIQKFIHMMFHNGDPARPNCYEHYNPDTGHASLYRGFDDYQHSWVNDLIVKYVAGFRPSDGGGFTVDPFPFDMRSLQLSRLPFRGHQIDLAIEDQRFAVHVDGKLVGDGQIGEPLEATL